LRNSVLGVVVRNGTNVAQFSDFVPIEPLNRSDADVNLVFLSGNGVFYLQPATDEWYKSGPAPFNRTVVSGDTQLYVPEEAASVLGCADQYQFCNSALHESERCGPLASLADAIAGAAPYFDSSWTNFKLNIVNSTTAARFQYFMRTFYSSFSSVVYVLQHLGPTALESQRSLIDGDQWRIAPNQWQLDVRRWWNISMAITQTDFVNTAYGPTDPTLLRARVNFTTPDFKKLCNNQVCYFWQGHKYYAIPIRVETIKCSC
jgi:hypothetical protein